MNRKETIALCRYLQALCPNQKLDKHTPNAWADILTNIDYLDAKLAIQNITHQNDKYALNIDVRMIYNEAKTIRQNRRNKANPTPADNNRPPTNPAEYCKWLQQQNHQQAQLEKHQYAQDHTITY